MKVGDILTVGEGELQGELVGNELWQESQIPPGDYSLEEYQPYEPSSYYHKSCWMIADVKTLDDPDADVYYVDDYDLRNWWSDKNAR